MRAGSTPCSKNGATPCSPRSAVAPRASGWRGSNCRADASTPCRQRARKHSPRNWNGCVPPSFSLRSPRRSDSPRAPARRSASARREHFEEASASRQLRAVRHTRSRGFRSRGSRARDRRGRLPAELCARDTKVRPAPPARHPLRTARRSPPARCGNATQPGTRYQPFRPARQHVDRRPRPHGHGHGGARTASLDPAATAWQGGAHAAIAGDRHVARCGRTSGTACAAAPGRRCRTHPRPGRIALGPSARPVTTARGARLPAGPAGTAGSTGCVLAAAVGGNRWNAPRRPCAPGQGTRRDTARPAP